MRMRSIVRATLVAAALTAGFGLSSPNAPRGGAVGIVGRDAVGSHAVAVGIVGRDTVQVRTVAVGIVGRDSVVSGRAVA